MELLIILTDVVENEIDLIKWLLPFLNDKGKDKYNFILNQLLIIKTFKYGVGTNGRKN